MASLLPVRPRPHDGELFTSWLMRLAHANVQRLPYFTRTLTGDPNFWVHDADRHLPDSVALNVSEVTGVPVARIEDLTLQVFSGVVFPGFLPRTVPRWVLPLYMKGYRRERPGLVYCPVCLREGLYLRQVWRLSFLTACPAHGCTLLDVCPACQAPYAPQRNDLGLGVDWSVHCEPPFGVCAACGADLRDEVPEPAELPLLGFQGTLLRAVHTGALAWTQTQTVPSLEGFNVLHQLLAVALQRDMQSYLIGTCGLEAVQRPPEQRNRTFEDHTLDDRRRLLLQVAWLTKEWPSRLVQACEAACVYRRPLMANFIDAPAWYEAVAAQVSRANGRRPYRRVRLHPYLSLEALEQERDQAPTADERRRWAILCRYYSVEEMLPVARTLGVSFELVHRTVTRYNAGGPEALRHPQRGKKNHGRRALTVEDAEELRQRGQRSTMTYSQMADWVEARTGKRPNQSTIWMYKRNVESHSNQGRKSKGNG